MAASNSAVGRYNNAVTVVNDIRKKIDSLKYNDPEVCLNTIYSDSCGIQCKEF